LTGVAFQQFVDAGAGKNVKFIDLPDFTFRTMWGTWIFNRAPHPSAAKLFVNWCLTREGALAHLETKFNSRRLDVPAADPIHLPKAGQFYTSDSFEEGFADLAKTNALLTEWQKQLQS